MPACVTHTAAGTNALLPGPDTGDPHAHTSRKATDILMACSSGVAAGPAFWKKLESNM